MDPEIAVQVGFAFDRRTADAVHIHEAEDNARLYGRTFGFDAEATIEKARHRYVAPPRSGTQVYIEILEGAVGEEID